MRAAQPRAIVVMGVTGAGKSTVGDALAQRLGWRFRDADDFHSDANVARMRAGEPLDDATRGPWLASLNDELRRAAAERTPVVLACSALKARYRRQLTDGVDGVAFVYLHGRPETLHERVTERTDHFMDPGLLASQLDDLEEPAPGEALRVELDQPVAQTVTAIVEGLGLSGDPAVDALR